MKDTPKKWEKERSAGAMSTPPPTDGEQPPDDQDGQQQPEQPGEDQALMGAVSQDERAAKRKQRGRPPKWPKERRIPLIYEGRMSFQPGDEHFMDKQIEEARRLSEEITEQLAQVQQLVIDLNTFDSPGAWISEEEAAIKALLWDMYSARKHRDHILATFIVARRRRLLQRLQAAQAALEQARDFLAADEAMLPRLRQTIAEAQAAELALHGPPPSYPAGAPEAEEEEEDQADDEDESEAEDQAESEAEDQADDEDQDQAARRELLHTTGGGDDAQQTRAALAAFEQRARAMRSAIASGRGWFEWFFIPRSRRYTEEARAYLKREEPIPPDVQVYIEEEDEHPYGPYLRYRWYEGGGRQKPIKYSLGMGLITRRNPRRTNEPPTL
jgi:hypothetical protein